MRRLIIQHVVPASDKFLHTLHDFGVPGESCGRRYDKCRLRGMIEDTMQLSLTMMQWLGTSEAPSFLNRDLGMLEGEPLGGKPLFSFQRFDLRLEEEWLETWFGLPFETREILRLSRLDDASAMPALYDLASMVAQRMISLE